MTKQEKKLYRKFFKQTPAEPLLSLEDQERITFAGECYDGCYKYGFLHGDCSMLSDEEINEIFEDECVEINSPYDCTGRWCTSWIAWHRNPSGKISYVHRMILDV